jgi:hypothetical protein
MQHAWIRRRMPTLLVTLEDKSGLHVHGRTEKKNMTETQP